MPPPTKRQKQAKQQCASGIKYFDNGLVQDLLDIAVDPDYQLDGQDESETTDSDHSTVDGMSFNFFDFNLPEELTDHAEELPADDIVCTGEKRINLGMDLDAEDNAPDYAEQCAYEAAVSARTFWANIMSSVSLETTRQSQTLHIEVTFLAG